MLYQFVRFKQQFCSIRHGTGHSHGPTSLPYPYQACSSFRPSFLCCSVGEARKKTNIFNPSTQPKAWGRFQIFSSCCKFHNAWSRLYIPFTYILYIPATSFGCQVVSCCIFNNAWSWSYCPCYLFYLYLMHSVILQIAQLYLSRPGISSYW